MSTGTFTCAAQTNDTAPRTTWAPLGNEKSFFVLASFLDVLMTSILLQTGAFFESNPLADFFISGWGLAGMIAFKLVLVGFVLLIVNIIAIWRVNTARWVLYFGTLVTGAVVIYSYYLLANFAGA